jgi:hypothetical protein
MIKERFKEANKLKFSYVLLVKENIEHSTFKFLSDSIDKVNLVALRKSEIDDIELAVQLSDFVVTGIGEVLDECVKQGKPVLVDVHNNHINTSYPQSVDFFDPFRNEHPKPIYKDRELNLFLKEIYNQLDRFKIDYVNYL